MRLRGYGQGGVAVVGRVAGQGGANVQAAFKGSKRVKKQPALF